MVPEWDDRPPKEIFSLIEWYTNIVSTLLKILHCIFQLVIVNFV